MASTPLDIPLAVPRTAERRLYTPVFFGLTGLGILSCIAFDRLALARADAWMRFAGWLVG